MSGPNLAQRRAANAYKAVAAAPESALEIARRLPMMLQTNGLLATWAFLLSKDAEGKPLAALLGHLQSTQHVESKARSPHQVFLSWVGGKGGAPAISGNALRQITEEAVEFAGWLKRAAEAASGQDEGGKTGAASGY